MAKLLLNYNGKTQHEYELNQEEITIGRKSDNDIHIDNMAVSSRHAKILTILNDSFIEDLESTNGTIINGNKISKYALKNGDIIKIGNHSLIYINECENDFEKTMIIRPDVKSSDENSARSIGNITAELALAGTTNTSPGEAKLQLLTGDNSGQELKLTKILTTLGKPGLQVAAITRRPKGYFLIVVDSGKSGATPLVNDIAIGRQAHLLGDGDIIEVAGVKMGFSLQ